MKLSLTKIPLLLLIISATYGLTTFYLDWRIPRATAVLKVHPSALPSSTGMLYSGYMENQFELILSAETMNLASDRLNLPANPRREAWNPLANRRPFVPSPRTPSSPKSQKLF